jgi:hypothetical protein
MRREALIFPRGVVGSDDARHADPGAGRCLHSIEHLDLQRSPVVLREPEHDCHVADLVALGSPAPDVVQRVASSDGVDARAIPDPQARAAYRARLEDLRSELAEAERNNDVGAASRLCAEIEALGEELAQSFGWGGQNRTANQTVEKMRKAVQGAIRNALHDLDSAHPEAGRHFYNSLVTGVFCVYRPEQAVRRRVETE